MAEHHPRHGSLQFWPRARAKSIVARPDAFPQLQEQRLPAFLGYKVGMTHLIIQEQNPNSHRKNQNIFCPVTVLECPPMKVYSVRFYKKTEDGKKIISEIFSQAQSKQLQRKIKPSKKQASPPDSFNSLSIVCYTQPHLTVFGKKTPDMLEIHLYADKLKECADFALSLLNKEMKVSEIFRVGQHIDIHSITKGKGFCGVIKKFGVKKRPHKSEKKVRGIGTLGPWHPNKVMYTVAQAGKFGFFTRTEYNKLLLKIGSKPEEINPKSGFQKYGFIKNDFILVKGSVPGTPKRPVTITYPIRLPASRMQIREPVIKHINKGS